MFFQKLKVLTLGLVGSSILLAGTGVLARQQAGRAREPIRVSKPDDSAPARKAGDPAEERMAPAPSASVAAAASAAIAPRSSADLIKEMVQAARHAYLANRADYHRGRGTAERVRNASMMLMDAEKRAGSRPDSNLAAITGHFERMRELVRAEKNLGDDDPNGAEARAFLAEAELLLAQAKGAGSKPAPEAATAGRPGTRTGPGAGPGPGPGHGHGHDPKSQAILEKLEAPVAMSFPNEVPLEDVLKYIKQSTRGRNDSEIPIYVDPAGLREADKTPTSTIQIDLEGVPLRRTLQLLLSQLGLVYFVDDGILVITSEGSTDRAVLPSSRAEPSPFLQKRERAERGDMTPSEMEEFLKELKLRKEVLKSLDEIEAIEKKPAVDPQ